MISKPAVAVALLLFLAAGCGSTGIPVNSSSSPLGNGGDSYGECIPDPSGTTITDGITVLENHSKGTVTIEQVSFYGDCHLQFVHAVVVPIRYYAIGTSAGWPPARMNITVPGVQWDKRVAATGARLPPDPAHSHDRNLVIGMRPTAHTSSTKWGPGPLPGERPAIRAAHSHQDRGHRGQDRAQLLATPSVILGKCRDKPAWRRRCKSSTSKG